MSTVREIRARQILDSRGNPTVEVDVRLDDGSFGRASIPSGVSTGTHEALELRDGGTAWGGLAVTRAIAHVEGEIRDAVVGRDGLDQKDIDMTLVALDGTPNKARLGANAILGTSLAVARAAAACLGQPLYRHLGGEAAHVLPVPFLNVINGGRHADNPLDMQEFMVVPLGFGTFHEALEGAVGVYRQLKAEIHRSGWSTAVGDEGGFAPPVGSGEVALDLLSEAIVKAGYTAGREVALAVDPAASEFRSGHGYRLEGREVSASELVDLYEKWIASYPIVTLEDPMGEDDLEGWQEVTSRLGGKVQIIGDDVFVTQVARLEEGARNGVANAILIKLNQVGTLTETLETMRRAKELGYRCVVSHRSGETEDAFIADFTVATGAGQIKTGAPAREERGAKYNQLLRIEEELEHPEYPGPLALTGS